MTTHIEKRAASLKEAAEHLDRFLRVFEVITPPIDFDAAATREAIAHLGAAVTSLREVVVDLVKDGAYR